MTASLRRLSLTLALTLAACVTHIAPSRSQNPAPSEAFARYARFELTPLRGADGEVTAQSAAMAKIQASINERLGPRINAWNAKPTTGDTRTLVIEPVVTQLKFVGGGKRFWAGSSAGSSAVILRARFSDKATGTEVANAEFYAKAAAMGGAYSMGGTDNAMLDRIGNSLAVYVIENHASAVGGPVEPTGKDARELARR